MSLVFIIVNLVKFINTTSIGACLLRLGVYMTVSQQKKLKLILEIIKTKLKLNETVLNNK